jgi:hypothetical protein
MSQKKKSGLQRGLGDIVASQTAPRADKAAASASLIGKFREDPGDVPVTPAGIPEAIPAGIPEGIPTSIPTTSEPRRSPETFTPLDATHTASEKSVYSIMYRETVSKGVDTRRFGPAELIRKTGIRSRNTVHRALYGLAEKLSVEVVEEAKGNTFGPLYRVHRPQDIEQRRKAAGILIDPQSKRIVSGIPAGIPTSIPTAIPNNEYPSGDTTIPIIGIHIKEDQIKDQNDDEAAPPKLRALERELTGKNGARGEQWDELFDVLAAELRIAAARTTVSNVPAFLAEHLRRRLWKLDKKQAEREGRELPDQVVSSAAREVAPAECPDCKGSGWWYPDGPEKGVTKCKHSRVEPKP